MAKAHDLFAVVFLNPLDHVGEESQWFQHIWTFVVLHAFGAAAHRRVADLVKPLGMYMARAADGRSTVACTAWYSDVLIHTGAVQAHHAETRKRAMQRRRGTRIQSDLCVLTPVRRIRGGWWDSLGLWRWLGIGASIAALSLLAVNLVVLREVQQSVRAVAQHGHLVARIARNDGVAYWTATIGIKHASLVIVPAVVP